MKFFQRKNKILDLTKYKKPETEKKTESSENFGFLGNLASSSSDSEYLDISKEERKRKLANRLLEITKRIEELSNQLYRLQQKVELLEKKIEVK